MKQEELKKAIPYAMDFISKMVDHKEIVDHEGKPLAIKVVYEESKLSGKCIYFQLVTDYWNSEARNHVDNIRTKIHELIKKETNLNLSLRRGELHGEHGRQFCLLTIKDSFSVLCHFLSRKELITSAMLLGLGLEDKSSKLSMLNKNILAKISSDARESDLFTNQQAENVASSVISSVSKIFHNHLVTKPKQAQEHEQVEDEIRYANLAGLGSP